MKQETLYITKNTPFIKDLRVLDQVGDPVDLTNYTSSMFIAKYFDSTTKYEVNAVIHDALQGIVRTSISSLATNVLPYGTMQYSIFLQETGGENTLLLQGQVVVIPTV